MTFPKILLAIALISSISIVVTFFIVTSPVNQESNQTWYGTYSAEAEDCFRYGGGMTTAKNGTTYCSKGTGAPLNEDESCPDGYLRVENSYPASKYDGYYSCHEEKFVNNAKCDKYWELIWSKQGVGCSRLNDDEKAILQNEEILENQKYIKELLEDIYDQES
jgi:hypothetical protein